MFDAVDVAAIDRRASGEVVPMPTFPVVELAVMPELKVRFPAALQMARVLAEPAPVSDEPPMQVLLTEKHPVATLTPPLNVEVPAPVAKMVPESPSVVAERAPVNVEVPAPLT